MIYKITYNLCLCHNLENSAMISDLLNNYITQIYLQFSVEIISCMIMSSSKCKLSEDFNIYSIIPQELLKNKCVINITYNLIVKTK